jgi:hypothetical protein
MTAPNSAEGYLSALTLRIVFDVSRPISFLARAGWARFLIETATQSHYYSRCSLGRAHGRVADRLNLS